MSGDCLTAHCAAGDVLLAAQGRLQLLDVDVPLDQGIAAVMPSPAGISHHPCPGGEGARGGQAALHHPVLHETHKCQDVSHGCAEVFQHYSR